MRLLDRLACALVGHEPGAFFRYGVALSGEAWAETTCVRCGARFVLPPETLLRRL